MRTHSVLRFGFSFVALSAIAMSAGCDDDDDATTTSSDGGTPSTSVDGGAITSPDGAVVTPPSGNASAIEILNPSTTGNAAAFALGNGGHVALMTGTSFTSFDGIAIWKGGVSTPVPLGAFTFSPNGLNLTACLTTDGKLGFNALKDGSNIVAFFDGATTADIGIAPGKVLIDCNDGPIVVGGSAGSGTGDHVWTGSGAPTPLAGTDIGKKAVQVNANGTILVAGGTTKGGTYTAFPEAAKSIIAVGISDKDLVVGSLIEGSSVVPATYQLGSDVVTKLPIPPGFSSGVAFAADDAGNVLVVEQKKWAIYSGGTYKTPELAGYNVSRAVTMNASGQVLVSASKEGAPNVIALLVKP